MATVIILGAKGRFGRAAAQAFETAGWSVIRAGRGMRGAGAIDLDATDRNAVIHACSDCDVIVNAVNPPYHHWTEVVPSVTKTVIAAARATGATVVIPGNIYNYGRALPRVLREETAWVGNTRKGRIRIRMEDTYRDSGVRTIVLRGGDYLATEQTGAWFEAHMAPKVHQGKFVYPGPLDQEHAWAYLPDIARALVGLVEKRLEFSTFEEFGFDGFTLTGAQLADHVAAIVGKPMRVSQLPWWAVRIMGLWSPLMREVIEMRYLWQRPHRVDGQKLRDVLPDFEPTPVRTAIARCLPVDTDAYASVPKTA